MTAPEHVEDPFATEFLDDHQILRELYRRVVRIEDQVTRTNGRVGRLEDWRSFTTGALAVVVMVVVPLFLWMVQGGA